MCKSRRGAVMNRKGDINVVLKLILAVVGLTLIFFAAGKIYSGFVGQDDRNAENTINAIEAKINALDKGESTLFNSRGPQAKADDDEWWYFVGWSKDESTRPDKCFFESCICMCNHPAAYDLQRVIREAFITAVGAGPPSFSGPSKEDLSVSCQNNGICRDVDYESVNIKSSWKHTHTYYFHESGVAYADLVSNGTFVYFSDSIIFPDALAALDIETSESELNISYAMPRRTRSEDTGFEAAG